MGHFHSDVCSRSQQSLSRQFPRAALELDGPVHGGVLAQLSDGVQKDRTEKDKFHVIFCPTDKWHRVADMWRNSDPNAHLKPVLTGYFYLPGRTTSSAEHNVSGVEDWVKRKQLGGASRMLPFSRIVSRDRKLERQQQQWKRELVYRK